MGVKAPAVKRIYISHHAKVQMEERGVAEAEVAAAIREGEQFPAKQGRIAFRKNFAYNGQWGEKHYHIKQVVPITVEEKNRFVVVTVFSYFF